MTFLCWNLNKRSIEKLVAELVAEKRVDVIVLLECMIGVGEILATLNEATGEIFHFSDSPAQIKTIRVFTRFSNQFLRVIDETPHYALRHIVAPAQTDLLLAVVHFQSKLWWTDASQSQECTVLARRIESAEKLIGHFRTILVGDFNMNPFEAGMVGTVGLNATMARGVARKETRTVQGNEYRFFYNPMWQHFGDRGDSPAGTYHYDNNQHVTYFWNMFDQVLVRPSLMDHINADTIEIIDRVGSVSLLTANGAPDRSVGSDHLPLTFIMGFSYL